MKRSVCLLAALTLIATAVLTACGDDDDDEAGITGTPATPTQEEAAAQQTVRQALEAYNRQDIATFITFWTDRGLQDEFGVTRQEIAANPADFAGPPQTIRSFTETEIEGNEASTDAEFVIGRGVLLQRLNLVRQDGTWKIDSTEPLQARVPSGVTTVDVEMKDFAYEYDMSKIGDGNIAFKAENTGSQPHEIVLLKVPPDFNLEQALQSPVEPAGVETIALLPPVDRGDEGMLVFTDKLEPGRYLMICFLPDTSDPQGTPHALKGMTSEFDVAVAGGGR
jgi:hypothetical protein